MSRALRSDGFIAGLYGDVPASINPAYLSGFYAGALARLRFN